MNTNQRSIRILVLVISLILMGCVLGQALGSTPIPTPRLTSTPSLTPTLTETNIATYMVVLDPNGAAQQVCNGGGPVPGSAPYDPYKGPHPIMVCYQGQCNSLLEGGLFADEINNVDVSAAVPNSIDQLQLVGCITLKQQYETCGPYKVKNTGELFNIQYKYDVISLEIYSAQNLSEVANISRGTGDCPNDAIKGGDNYSPYPFPGTAFFSVIKQSLGLINIYTLESMNGLSGVTELAAGFDFACAIVARGQVQCWGENGYGQLGNGNTQSSDTPVYAAALVNVISISAGEQAACAVMSDHTVRCWGEEMVFGSNREISVPTAVAGINDAISVKVGGGSACAITSDKRVKCWGVEVVDTGKSSPQDSRNAVYIEGLKGVTDLAVGASGFGCAVLDSGQVMCWGRNDIGYLGNGQSTRWNYTPGEVAGISDAINISAGDDHACVLMRSGTIKCWGRNSEGELGNGTSTGNIHDPTSVVDVKGISDAIAIFSGQLSSCALLSNGTVKCWGGTFEGKPITAPVPVTGLSNVIKVAVGGQACALTEDNEVQCWKE